MTTLPQNKYDRSAVAIGEARRAAEELSRIGTRISVLLCDLDNAVGNIINAEEERDREPARRMLLRIHRLRELNNMMELGSFSIELGRVLDAAWRRFP